MLEKYNSLHTQLPYLPHMILLSTFMAGVMIGFIISGLTKQDEEQSCKIEYISRDELLSFEKARVARTKEKQLFFGKTREAISLIQSIAKTRGTSGSHVIFTKGSYVKGKGVYSISEEIHREVVQTLKNRAKSSKRNENKNDGGDGEKSGDAEMIDEEEQDRSGSTSNKAMKLLEELEESTKW